MNPPEAIEFSKSPTGKLLWYLLGVVGLLLIIWRVFAGHKDQITSADLAALRLNQEKPQLIQTIERYMTPYKPPVAQDPKQPAPPAQKRPLETPAQEHRLAPISIYPESVSSTPEPKPLGKFYAPYGRLIPCELIVTVDSSLIRTPIVGLITEDIYHDGRLIIPAGTEVHGIAQVDRSRERIASSREWTLVWQSGEELRLSGIALDREKDPSGDGWGITDGSAGLRGQLLKTDDMAEIKLFAATFLSGAASSLTERQSTIFGSQNTSSFQNAPLQGAQDVLGVYAKQILDSIQRDGFYVRVPAGKEFYLYVTQTIDKADAVIGSTRFITETNQPASNIFNSIRLPAGFQLPYQYPNPSNLDRQQTKP